MSASCFEIIVQTHARLLYSFLTQIFLLLVDHHKEFMKLNVGMVVSNMTQESCIPIDLMKSCDGCSNLVHYTEIGQ